MISRTLILSFFLQSTTARSGPPIDSVPFVPYRRSDGTLKLADKLAKKLDTEAQQRINYLSTMDRETDRAKAQRTITARRSSILNTMRRFANSPILFNIRFIVRSLSIGRSDSALRASIARQEPHAIKKIEDLAMLKQARDQYADDVSSSHAFVYVFSLVLTTFTQKARRGLLEPSATQSTESSANTTPRPSRFRQTSYAIYTIANPPTYQPSEFMTPRTHASTADTQSTISRETNAGMVISLSNNNNGSMTQRTWNSMGSEPAGPPTIMDTLPSAIKKPTSRPQARADKNLKEAARKAEIHNAMDDLANFDLRMNGYLE